MRKLFFIGLAMVGFLFLANTTASAQKIGYVNSVLILSNYPAAVKADKDIVAFQEGLLAQGKTKAEALQAKFEKYSKEVQAGNLAPIEVQKREQEVQKDQQALAAFEQEVLAKVQKKREELFSPVLQSVQQAIDAVAKEKGYQFIFDTSVSNIILHGEESDDIYDLVAAKLGI